VFDIRGVLAFPPPALGITAPPEARLGSAAELWPIEAGGDTYQALGRW